MRSSASAGVEGGPLANGSIGSDSLREARDTFLEATGACPESGTETTHQRIAIPSSLSSVAVKTWVPSGCAALRIVAGASNSVLKPWRTDTLPSALLTNTEIGMACSTPALQAVILPTRASPVAFCKSKLLAAATTAARPVSTSSAETGGAGLRTNRLACSMSRGAGSLGAMITRAPRLVRRNSLMAKACGRRMQPCEAGRPVVMPECSATPDMVRRCM